MAIISPAKIIGCLVLIFFCRKVGYMRVSISEKTQETFKKNCYRPTFSLLTHLFQKHLNQPISEGDH